MLCAGGKRPCCITTGAEDVEIVDGGTPHPTSMSSAGHLLIFDAIDYGLELRSCHTRRRRPGLCPLSEENKPFRSARTDISLFFGLATAAVWIRRGALLG